MQRPGFLKLVFLLSSLFLAVSLNRHIKSECPLTSPLPYELENDYLCLYSHKAYHRANIIYDSSPLKPVVEKAYVHLQPYIAPIQEKYDSLHASITQYREENEEYIRNQTYTTASRAITVTLDFLQNTVFPNVASAALRTSTWVCEAIRWVKYHSFITFNIYVRPQLIKTNKLFWNSAVGAQLTRLSNTPTATIVVQYLNVIKIWLVSASEFISTKFAQAKEACTFKGTESYRIMKVKENFLKDYAQYLPENFRAYASSSASSSSSSTSSTSFSSSISASTATPIATSQSAPQSVSTSEKFTALVQTTIESAEEDFNAELARITSEYTSRLRAQFQPHMQALAQAATSGYDNLHDYINKINVAKVLTDDGHVSRELFREDLAAKRAQVDGIVENINSEIEKVAQKYTDDVLKAKLEVIETLEEFAESTLTAYSAAIISNGDAWDEWKKYSLLKNDIVKFRDKLVESVPKSFTDEAGLELNFENALNGLKKDVLVLHNEAGGYMAILRAKANVEFQAREAEEKAAAAAAAAAAISGNPEQKEHDHAEEEGEEENDYEYDEYDGEEKETNTITRTRTVTVTLDDTVSSADAAVDVVPEAAAPAEVAEPIAEDTPEVEDSIPIEEKEEEEETSVADPEPAPLPTTSEFAINTVSGDSDEVKVHLEPIV
jgi:uncharacterized protein YukE